MTNVVVKIEKSGNRFNAWDSDGNKFTSQISTSTRKKAFNAGMALEQRTGKNGRTYWWKVPMSEFENQTTPVVDVATAVPCVDVIDKPESIAVSLGAIAVP